VFFVFMFVCSVSSIKGNAAVFESIYISDSPVHRIVGRDRFQDMKMCFAKVPLCAGALPSSKASTKHDGLD
jgi:hypothetical protein